uniref:Malic enzyme NAD-binding domain-containing protein n=1 Tax=Setaria italica TaxID=4555 RepID=K3ZPN5_SETIT
MTLFDAVLSIKPTVLIGTSGVGRTSTKYVVETMASFNEELGGLGVKQSDGFIHSNSGSTS